MKNLVKENTIVSIFSPASDLQNSKSINFQGVNFLIHQNFFETWQFTQHFLLCTGEYEKHAQHFKKMITQQFNHRVEVYELKHPSEQLIVDPDLLRQELVAFFDKYKKQYNFHYLLNPGFGLLKLIVQEIKSLYNISILMLDYDSRKNKNPQLLKLTSVQAKNAYNEQIHDVPKLMLDSLKRAYEKALKIAPLNESVIIIGESGTGKELLAKYIHQNSSRKNMPFETINCSALRPELLESRLFGHKKGSFTDANEDRKGIFEEANGGTVFLDEIGDIDPYMQQLLLRFLQFKEIQPIGKKSKKVDVRIVAATNQNLAEMVKQNRFRNDLFYRMGIFIELQPFRLFTKSEKLKAFDYFIKIKKIELSKPNPIQFTDKLTHFLLEYPFPGNFRELDMLVKHLYLFSNSNIVDVSELPPYIFFSNKQLEQDKTLKVLIKEHCKNVYLATNRNFSQTAKILDISLNTLKKYLSE
ncbi:MAG: hypothetical protein Fur0028_12880 [Bacteroidales bacterium]